MEYVTAYPQTISEGIDARAHALGISRFVRDAFHAWRVVGSSNQRPVDRIGALFGPGIAVPMAVAFGMALGVWCGLAVIDGFWWQIAYFFSFAWVLTGVVAGMVAMAISYAMTRYVALRIPTRTHQRHGRWLLAAVHAGSTLPLNLGLLASIALASEVLL